MKEITGNLIQLAKDGSFDAIGHGCNCFCRMKRGIAPLMAEAFGCHNFPLESPIYMGDFNKLGQIDGKIISTYAKPLMVFNMYSQFHWLEAAVHGKTPLDYTALRMCLRKLNYRMKGMEVGLPRIGCGLAGGKWEAVKEMMIIELKDCNLTVVSLEDTATTS